MADETTITATKEAPEPKAEQPEATQEATDWKAKYEAMREHSREWEKKAKGNQSAADELEKLKAEQLSEQERANKRAEKAEQELAELKARAARTEAIAKIAVDEGISPDIVSMLSGKDGEELAEQVAKLKKLMPAYPTRTDDGGTKAAAAKTEIPIIF